MALVQVSSPLGVEKEKVSEKEKNKGGDEIDASSKPTTTMMPTPTPAKAKARKPKTYAPLASGGGHPPNLPASITLIAKRITRSDLSGGRLILPRASVERNLPFMRGFKAWMLSGVEVFVSAAAAGSKSVSPSPPPPPPSSSSPATAAATKIDASLVLKSWANGSETRRVYVLEGAARAMAPAAARARAACFVRTFMIPPAKWVRGAVCPRTSRRATVTGSLRTVQRTPRGSLMLRGATKPSSSTRASGTVGLDVSPGKC